MANGILGGLGAASQPAILQQILQQGPTAEPAAVEPRRLGLRERGALALASIASAFGNPFGQTLAGQILDRPREEASRETETRQRRFERAERRREITEQRAFESKIRQDEIQEEIRREQREAARRQDEIAQQQAFERELGETEFGRQLSSDAAKFGANIGRSADETLRNIAAARRQQMAQELGDKRAQQQEDRELDASGTAFDVVNAAIFGDANLPEIAPLQALIEAGEGRDRILRRFELQLKRIPNLSPVDRLRALQEFTKELDDRVPEGTAAGPAQSGAVLPGGFTPAAERFGSFQRLAPGLGAAAAVAPGVLSEVLPTLGAGRRGGEGLPDFLRGLLTGGGQ